MAFATENDRFKTTSHQQGSGEGNSTGAPLLTTPVRQETDGSSLGIEPVTDKKGYDDGLYWFVWYGPRGEQRTKMSAVFTKSDLFEAAARFEKAAKA